MGSGYSVLMAQVTDTVVSEWCNAVASEPAGSWARLSVAQDLAGRWVSEGNEPAVAFAAQALVGWLDLDCKAGPVAQAVRSEVNALVGWLRG
jgi:hypothetical protein